MFSYWCGKFSFHNFVSTFFFHAEELKALEVLEEIATFECGFRVEKVTSLSKITRSRQSWVSSKRFGNQNGNRLTVAPRKHSTLFPQNFPPFKSTLIACIESVAKKFVRLRVLNFLFTTLLFFFFCGVWDF